MPTYEYACQKCDKHFDVVQKFTDDTLTHCLCPENGEVKKVFSAVGIAFKGSGFYKTDSRGGGTKAASSSGDSGGESGGSGSGEAGSKGDGGSSKADGGASTPAAAPSTPAPAKAPATPTPSS